MNRIVKLILGPSITETGVIARVVELTDSSLELQSYSKSGGWTTGGFDLLSIMTAEQAEPTKLERRGLTPQQIEEVLFDPERSA